MIKGLSKGRDTTRGMEFSYLNSEELVELSKQMFTEVALDPTSDALFDLCSNIYEATEKGPTIYKTFKQGEGSGTEITALDVLGLTVRKRDLGHLDRGFLNGLLATYYGNGDEQIDYTERMSLDAMSDSVGRALDWELKHGTIATALELNTKRLQSGDETALMDSRTLFAEVMDKYGPNRGVNGAFTMGTSIKKFGAMTDAISRIEISGRPGAMLKTGYTPINNAIGGGFKLGHVAGIIARTHNGKSAIAMALLLSMSLENDVNELRQSIVDRNSSVDGPAILTDGVPTLIHISTEDSLELTEENLIRTVLAYDDAGGAVSLDHGFRPADVEATHEGDKLSKDEVSRLAYTLMKGAPIEIIRIKIDPTNVGIENVLEKIDELRRYGVAGIDGKYDPDSEDAKGRWIIGMVLDYPSLLSKSDIVKSGVKQNGDEFKKEISILHSYCQHKHMFGMVALQASPSATATDSQDAQEVVKDIIKHHKVSDSSKIPQELQCVIAVELMKPGMNTPFSEVVIAVGVGKVKGSKIVDERDKYFYLIPNNPTTFMSPNMAWSMTNSGCAEIIAKWGWRETIAERYETLTNSTLDHYPTMEDVTGLINRRARRIINCDWDNGTIDTLTRLAIIKAEPLLDYDVAIGNNLHEEASEAPDEDVFGQEDGLEDGPTIANTIAIEETTFLGNRIPRQGFTTQSL